MTSNLTELQAVIGRLERLEKENKRFRVAGALLLLFSLIFLSGAATQKGRRTVTANEFLLEDDQGRTRAKLAVDSKVPSKRVDLVFFDETGNKQMSLTSHNDAAGHGHAHLALGKEAVSAHYVLAGTDSDEWAVISDGGVFLAGKDATRIVLSASGPDSPSVEVADSHGYAAELGVGAVEYPSVGQTEKSSAASIRLLGKDRKLIWSAP